MLIGNLREGFRGRRVLLKAAALFFSTFAALAVGELVLRALLPKADEYYVRPPHMRRVFRPVPAVMPGVSGESKFMTNSMGLRGDELTRESGYRVLTVGGSTTECLYLDQDEAWPQLLQSRLDGARQGRKVWVGNAGRSGLNSRDHVIQLKHLLNQYGDIDAVVLLVGVNDLASRLRQDEAYDPGFMSRAEAEPVLLRRSFAVVPDASLPFYKKTALWRLLRGAKDAARPPRYAEGEVQDEAGKLYATWRERRRDAPTVRRTLPDLTTALEEYARNLGTIIDLARGKSVRLILVTQPTLWRRDMPAELSGLLWMGGVGDFQREAGKDYYSTEALEEGMALYNDTLLKTCRERGAECFDLAAVVPKDTSAFYDDCHFNEGGARLVAEAVAGYMNSTTPR